MHKEVYATIMALSAEPDNATSDRIEALTQGHGMLNVAAMSAARQKALKSAASMASSSRPPPVVPNWTPT